MVIAVVSAMEEKGLVRVLETPIHRWYSDEFIESYPEIVERRMKQGIGTDESVFLMCFEFTLVLRYRPGCMKSEPRL